MSRPHGQERQIFGRSQPAAASLQPRAVSPGTERPKRQNVFLKVDSPPAGESIASHDELIVSGWLAANEPVLEVSVEIAGTKFKAATGVHRPDLTKAYPGVPALAQAGFVATVHVPTSAMFAGPRVELQVTATTVSGLSRSEIIPLMMTSVVNPEIGVHQAQARSAQHPASPVSVGVKPVSQQAEVLLHLDFPAIVNGGLVKEVTGGLSLSGWALAQGGIDRIDILLDGKFVGKAAYGMRRNDVARTFPVWDDALLSGFGFSFPRRLLKPGTHRVTLEAFGKAAARSKVEFEVRFAAGDEQEGPSSLRVRLSEPERRMQLQIAEQFRVQPCFAIGVRVAGSDAGSLLESIRSIAAGSYAHWSILVVCASDGLDAIKNSVRDQCAELRPRITFQAEAGAAQSLERQLDKPIWHINLEAGDRLAADALFEFAAAINRNPTSDFVYGDDRRLGADGAVHEAFLKPDWSPDLLLSQNYIGRAFCVSERLLQQHGLSLAALENYDLTLQATENAADVAHVRQVVCEYAAPIVSLHDSQAVQKAAERRRLNCDVEAGLTPGTHRLRPRGARHDLVSIIIPTCGAGGLVEKCLSGLRENSAYRNLEVICVDNIQQPDSPRKAWLREQADVVVEILEPFNWSRFNNLAVTEASGDLLLFLNDDIEITQPDWLDVLVAIATRDEVGAVGPQLLYPTGKVQHAGLFLSKPGLARHAFRFASADDPGYCDLALSQRNVIAVTGACLMVRREVFEEVGGFDESEAVINNDVDFCLKCHVSGLRNVYTPFASLIHHELASRAHLNENHQTKAFAARWDSLFAEGDPFFHPDLDHESDDYAPEAEPVCQVIAGGPRYQPQSIRRILAVKLDHIGDFVTAFPAFQKLKQLFPWASLHVLAAPASRQIGFLEPAIDEIIPFEFFHARSGLGLQILGEDRLEALRGELAPYDFDLAIDFRKHTETRVLLQYAGAKLTAGYDHQNQFPWLDVALQWEGDPSFVTKRQHVSEDLINLVDAIGAAGTAPRPAARHDWPKQPVPLIAGTSRIELYSRPVVCVHPAAGTEMRQWPPSHFASLVNLLIENEGVNVALIGGADESDLGREVMKNVRFPGRVVSLVGQLKLDELAFFISSCALFVGNNSGPKHIAATLGVPTVGVHSGIVDAREWGPLGERALAIRRDMSCGPCYLSKREDCHRDLACLTGLAPRAVYAACQRLLALRHGGGNL
jgi:O-antigen biosynthesis protein